MEYNSFWSSLYHNIPMCNLCVYINRWWCVGTWHACTLNRWRYVFKLSSFFYQVLITFFFVYCRSHITHSRIRRRFLHELVGWKNIRKHIEDILYITTRYSIIWAHILYIICVSLVTQSVQFTVWSVAIHSRVYLYLYKSILYYTPQVYSSTSPPYWYTYIVL